MKKLLALIILIPFVYFSCKKDNSPIAEVPHENICQPGWSKKKKVLFIGIDGCRTDAFLKAQVPIFDSLMAHAYVNLHTDRGPQTSSAPGWSTILHGVWPGKHHITSNFFSESSYGLYHDMLYYMNQYNTKFSLAVATHWDDFLRIVSKEDYAVTLGSDLALKNEAVQILKNCGPDVLLLHFDDVDHAGHSSGFLPDNNKYIEAIQEVGSYVSEIMDVVQEREQNNQEEWLVVVVTDHGGNFLWHEMQDNIASTRIVFSIYRLPGMSRVDLPKASNVDVMPTVMKYMDVPVKPEWDLDGKALF